MSLKRLTLHVVRERLADYNKCLNNSRGAAALATQLIGAVEQEVVLVLLLDAKNRVTGYHEAARGSLTEASVHPREVFRVAVLHGAHAVLLVHNHPSADPSPSDSDCALTKRLVRAGALLNIRLLDHVIVTDQPEMFYSFADHGLLALDEDY